MLLLLSQLIIMLILDSGKICNSIFQLVCIYTNLLLNSVYKIDTKTFEVVDSITYIADLDQADHWLDGPVSPFLILMLSNAFAKPIHRIGILNIQHGRPIIQVELD